MKKLSKRGAKRLLNVVRALLDSPNPDKLPHEIYGHLDQAPPGALWHYVSRKDLQKTFRCDSNGWMIVLKTETLITRDFLEKHFSLANFEAINIFTVAGCRVRTANEIAKYIYDFVKRRRPEGI